MDSKADDEPPRPPGEEEEEVEEIDPITLKPDLYAAASANNTDEVIRLLEINVPPTYADIRTGLTALHWAAMNGNHILVKRLLEFGASEPYHSLKEKLSKKTTAQSPKKKKNRRQMTASSLSADGVEEEGKGEEDAMNEMKGTEEDMEDAEDHDENEEDDQFEQNMDALEVTTDYTQNTPLLWATHCGHLRVIWLLLSDGYSTNDIDKMGNNAVHLAAAYGDLKNLQVIINDGGNPNVVNLYKNLPIDLAKTKPIRDLLATAMVTGASMTLEDRQLKHDQNMKQYQRMMNTIYETIQDAMLQLQAAASSSSSSSSSIMNKKINRLLQEAIDLGKENALDVLAIEQASELLVRFESTQELIQDMLNLQKVMPISTQSQYIEYVYRLEKSIEKVIEIGIDQNQIQVALDLIHRCQVEYWLSILLTRLRDVTTADDSNEYDMNQLRKAIQKATLLQANEQMIEQGERFLKRLDAELGMSRAIKAIPTIRLPVDNAPEGYYTEKDLGKVQETEGYPLPPADTGEYVWIPAESFTSFQDAINKLRAVVQGAEQFGANQQIITESKERLVKADKELKQLEAKDTNDKLLAIEAVKKLAKKLKGKKKK